MKKIIIAILIITTIAMLGCTNQPGGEARGALPNITGYEVVYESCASNQGITHCQVICPNGKIVLGGGCAQTTTAQNTGTLLSSAPTSYGWGCYFYSPNLPSAKAICASP